jgi:hypothetical protein
MNFNCAYDKVAHHDALPLILRAILGAHGLKHYGKNMSKIDRLKSEIEECEKKITFTEKKLLLPSVYLIGIGMVAWYFLKKEDWAVYIILFSVVPCGIIAVFWRLLSARRHFLKLDLSRENKRSQ